MFDMTACLHALNTNNEVVRIIVESLCNLSKIHLLFSKLSIVNKKILFVWVYPVLESCVWCLSTPNGFTITESTAR